MSLLKETAVHDINHFKHFDVARSPKLAKSVHAVEAHPERLVRTYAAYEMIIRDLFNLNPGDVAIIKGVNESLGVQHGAHIFLDNMVGYQGDVEQMVLYAGDLHNKHNAMGIQELATKMNNAWKIRQSEPDWTPKDGDPRADRVIWGFVNGARRSMINVHFTVAHGLERILTQNLAKWDIPYTHHKDWLLHGMDDTIALLGLRGKFPESMVLDLWSTKRPDGLGWISAAKLATYKEAIAGETR